MVAFRDRSDLPQFGRTATPVQATYVTAYVDLVAVALDQTWADATCAVCDPVFEAAGVGFLRQIMHDDGGVAVAALLWEADPLRFAKRYPDSGVIYSYGDQWPPPCIDYWVYLDADAQEARLSVEGWNLREQLLPLTGDGTRDGLVIGAWLAQTLRVPSPSQ